METNKIQKGKLPSVEDVISSEKEIEQTNLIITEDKPEEPDNQENNGMPPSTSQTTTKVNAGPTVVKITNRIVTTTQPVTETKVTRKIVTTTTRGTDPNKLVNTRYNNNIIGNNPTVTQSRTVIPSKTNYIKPTVKVSTNYKRNETNTNMNNNRYISNNNNKDYKNVNPANKISRVQDSKSYSGDRNQPRRPEVPSSQYKPKAVSPGPGTIKRKTIYRGDPVVNIQITHIIYSSRPLEFNITDPLNQENLDKDPIQITEEDRINLKKSGKVETYTSVDESKIKKPEPPNLDGRLTHYQHAQGIGMTDDSSPNINPKFYFSEIKVLEPIVNKGEPIVKILTFRSDGKKTTRTVTKTQPKVNTTTSYTINKSNTSTQNRGYNTNPKQTSTVNNDRGKVTTVRTTNISTNNRGISGTGNNRKIVKETTTKVEMGSRSQYQNPSKPIVKTTTERQVYNQNSFFKK